MTTTYHVTSTEEMDAAKRLAGRYPHRCEKGRCWRNAWFMQHGRAKGGEIGMRVVCGECAKSVRWSA